MKPVIGITMGDPAGVGPEIIVKALAEKIGENDYRPVVIGDITVIQNAIDQYNIPAKAISISNLKDLPDTREILVYDFGRLDRTNYQQGVVHKGCGDIAYKTILKSVELAQTGQIDAIVTAPICKESLHLAGHYFDGHTGLIAHLTKTKKYRMLFSAERLKILHVTAHLSLREAINRLTPDLVYDSIFLGYKHLKDLGQPTQRIAVCGLNPHAGENGIFGREDLDIIQPAVEQAKAEGIDVEGPLPADTTFLKAYNNHYDMVIAQYHDQGHAPGKLVAFDTAVNVTVGLPVIRTSVDHGTAFDIAGKGLAKHGNLHCAIDYAVKLARKNDYHSCD